MIKGPSNTFFFGDKCITCLVVLASSISANVSEGKIHEGYWRMNEFRAQTLLLDSLEALSEHVESLRLPRTVQGEIIDPLK